MKVFDLYDVNKLWLVNNQTGHLVKNVNLKYERQISFGCLVFNPFVGDAFCLEVS